VVVARQETLSQEKPVDIVRRLFGPEHGIGLDIPQRGASSKRPPPDFSGGRLNRSFHLVEPISAEFQKLGLNHFLDVSM
jgi:hypothetical protein